tara:strand:+ start:689 stop:970 length:282 start_codon:yes stop_codon:yes gene_type:complete
MYVRIVEITAPTKLQLNIFLDYLRFTHFPKNLEQGQTSAKVFRVNEVSAFVIAEFKDKKSADKIKIMNNPEINELKTNLKIRSFEGPIEYCLD